MFRARFVTALIASTLLASTTSALRADDAVAECSVYPLAVGTQWIYAMGPVEMVERITAHEQVGGEMCAKLETIYNGQVVAFEHLAVREDGVYRVAVAGQLVDPPICFLKWPAQEGDRWEVASSIRGQSLSGAFVLSLGEVSVPAGEYQTVHAASEGFSAPAADGTTIPLVFSYDFATGVGKVRQIVQIGDRSTSMELKEVVFPE